MTDSEQINKRIAETSGWRGEVYGQLRELINKTEPKLNEVWKWDTAVWQLKTNVCAVSAFKDHVKINFFKGAKLPDPDGMFNSGLDSKQHRSINFFQSSMLDTAKLQTLIHEAAKLDG